jgi:hypothetical protein
MYYDMTKVWRREIKMDKEVERERERQGDKSRKKVGEINCVRNYGKIIEERRE